MDQEDVKDLPVTESDVHELDAGEESKMPDWAKAAMPNELMPPPDAIVKIIKLPKEITKRASLGDRTLVMWDLTLKDERNARARQEVLSGANMFEEFTKGTIRAMDGKAVTWTDALTASNLEKFWDQIGARGRSLLTALYMQTHHTTSEERNAFLKGCVVTRSVTP